MDKSTVYVLIPVEAESDVIKGLLPEAISSIQVPKRRTLTSEGQPWRERIALVAAAFVVGMVIAFLVLSGAGPGETGMMNALIHTDKPIESVLVNGEPVYGDIMSVNQRKVMLPVGKPISIRVRTSDGYEYPPKLITIDFDGQPVVFNRL